MRNNPHKSVLLQPSQERLVTTFTSKTCYNPHKSDKLQPSQVRQVTIDPHKSDMLQPSQVRLVTTLTIKLVWCIHTLQYIRQTFPINDITAVETT